MEKNTWKGYPIGIGKCHCGSETYITNRGVPKGWSGIECTGCGNLIENCVCGGHLPTKEQIKQTIQDQKCSECAVYELRDLYVPARNGNESIVRKKICTVTGFCEMRK